VSDDCVVVISEVLLALQVYDVGAQGYSTGSQNNYGGDRLTQRWASRGFIQ
jgi:hypothetical protein